jgi:hypothetical protein
MASKGSHLRDEVRREISELRGIGDEIRLKIKLGSMEARSAWNELEPKLENLERDVEAEGETILEATAQLAKDLKRAFVQFRDSV